MSSKCDYSYVSRASSTPDRSREKTPSCSAQRSLPTCLNRGASFRVRARVVAGNIMRDEVPNLKIELRESLSLYLSYTLKKALSDPSGYTIITAVTPRVYFTTRRCGASNTIRTIRTLAQANNPFDPSVCSFALVNGTYVTPMASNSETLLLESLSKTRSDCHPRPTGQTKRPLLASCLRSLIGFSGDAAPTWMTSYGA